MTSPETAPAPPEARAEPPALAWWRRLSDANRGDPGALARLRRSRSTLEALQVPQALELARRVRGVGGQEEVPDWRLRAALDLARVLAHVREHEPRLHPLREAGWKRPAGMRRESDAGEDRPRLAEARFRRLLQTGDGEEKVTAFVRLIVMLGGVAKVDDLARDFLSWNHPEYGDSIREKWAFQYFAAPEAAPSDPISDPSTDAEDDA